MSAPDDEIAREIIDPAALRRLVKASGLSKRQFAADVLAERGERTLRRWLKTGPPLELARWAERVVQLEIRPAATAEDPDAIEIHLVLRSRRRRATRPSTTE